MRIILISSTTAPILTFRSELIRHLRTKGYSVYALSTDYSDQTKVAVEALGAIPIDYSLSRSGLNPFCDLIDALQLVRILVALKPDVVFSFFVKPSIYGTLAARFAGVPRRIAMLEGLGHIYTQTKPGFTIKKKVLQFIHGALSTFAYTFADKVVFLNSDDPIDLSRKMFLKKDKIHILGPIGVNLLEYPKASLDLEKPTRFIFVARLLAEKGIFEYIAAARIVKQEAPDVEFVVLGGQDNENPSALSPDQLNTAIEDKIIIYPGFVDNVSDWIASSHVFVLPSYREGAPRSAQEAMAMGRAVITTDVPGCRDMVIDGCNGFLVPPWDSQALAKKMLFFVKHKESIRIMGEASYQIAQQRFDVSRINRNFEKILTGM